MEHLLSKIIKRRKRPTYQPEKEEEKKEEAASSSSSSSEEEEESATPDKPEWVYMTDPYGRPCWQNRKTGQVTYGNSYRPPGYNPHMGQNALDGDSDDDDDKKPAARPPAPLPPPVPVAVMPQHPGYGPPGMPYMHSPVHPQYFGHSPVPYGMSPVAVYPAAPWNAMPASPVPRQVPEYVKKKHAEEEKARKKKEEAEKKRIAAGVWERFYTDDGDMYWQHSVTGKKVSRDPYY